MSIGRVRSVRDIPYVINADTAYHPAFIVGAIERVRKQLPSKAGARLSEALEYCVSETVWAVVVEDNGKPLYVAKNLALAKTSLPYRRVLCVSFHDTSLPDSNFRMNVEYDP
jgi:hypothetical protein